MTAPIDSSATALPSWIVNAIGSCRADIHVLTDNVRWAYTNGFWPTARWIDAERGADLSRPIDDEDPDKIPGARYDLGVADHPSRQAVNNAAALVPRADLHLAAAVAATGPHPQPPTTGPPPDGWTASYILNALQRIGVRLDILAIALPATQRPERRTAGRLIQHAATDLTQAAAGTSRALDRGAAATAATGEPACIICNIRPRGDKTGKRCTTCKTWKDRNGTERPRTLDEQRIGDAIAAHQRRRARGEGWGAA